MGEKSADRMNIDAAFVRELAEMLDATGLSEIEVEDGERKIRVARTLTMAAPVAAPAAVMAAPAAAAPAAAPAPLSAPADDAVKSPMVGTAFLAPDPAAAPFAAVGAAVKAGDTILLIEAMKVMNPITAPTSGTLLAIHVENSQPVEFDQPLFTIG